MSAAKNLREALSFAARGIPVFPLRLAWNSKEKKFDKTPLVKWRDEATADADAIRRWGQQGKLDCGYGVPAGEPSGIFCVDVDGAEGLATLAALEAEHGAIPPTPRIRTISGGLHLYFRFNESLADVKNAVKFLPSLDIRSTGGLFARGYASDGKGYACENPGTPLADVPEWLIDLLTVKHAATNAVPAAGIVGATAYAQKALQGELGAVALAAKGNRNATLNAAAFALGQLVGGGELDQDEVERRLLDAALRCGLPEAEARKTIQSGLESGAKEPRTAPKISRAVEIPETQSKVKSDSLPDGFVMRESGLWHVEPKDDGEPVETWIGPPLHVLGLTRDEHGNAWGLLLEWHDPDGRRHIWAMPKALLVGKDVSAWLGRLADEGWCGAPGTSARTKLALFFTTCRTDRRALCVPRTGWHKGIFVLPDANIGETDGERIVLQVQTPHNPFRMAGTLGGWRDTVGAWSRGNNRLMLALCAALTAPLLEKAGQESGGFNWTGQSSTGKTTALVAAGSVWGKGSSSDGYVQNWRATSNGLEGLAALHSDAALCLDEIGQAPGRTVMEAAYMLANGMGKARAFQDGSAKTAKSWRCMVLSTGEKGLAEKIAEEGGKIQAGQSVRLVDVPADAGGGFGLFENLHGHADARAFADALKQSAATHYGHAARAFIAEMQKNRQQVKDNLCAALDHAVKLLCPARADGQVKRIARRFALCAVAGEMAAEWGILPWEQSEAFSAIKACWGAWLERRGGVGAAEDAAIVEQVSLFIEQHGASRFQDVDKPDAVCLNRVGFFRRLEDRTDYFVLPASFKEVCKGHDAARAARVLRDAGLLKPEGDRLKSRSPQLPGLGRLRCYVLTLCNGEVTL